MGLSVSFCAVVDHNTYVVLKEPNLQATICLWKQTVVWILYSRVRKHVHVSRQHPDNLSAAFKKNKKNNKKIN